MVNKFLMDQTLINDNNWNSFKDYYTVSWIISFPITLPNFDEIVFNLTSNILLLGRQNDVFVHKKDLNKSFESSNSIIYTEKIFTYNSFFSKLFFYHNNSIVQEKVFDITDILSINEKDRIKRYCYPNPPIVISNPLIYDKIFHLSILSKTDIWMPYVLNMQKPNSYFDNHIISKMNGLNLNKFIIGVREFVIENGGNFNIEDSNVLDFYKQFIDKFSFEIKTEKFI